jgi:hypothetical protein
MRFILLPNVSPDALSLKPIGLQSLSPSETFARVLLAVAGRSLSPSPLGRAMG